MKDQSRATMSLFGRLGVRVQEACISITLPRRDARDDLVAARHSMLREIHRLLSASETGRGEEVEAEIRV